MAITLYGSPLSPYVRAARAAFVEKGADYDFVPIGPVELRAPEYTKRHPFRKLPALDVAGTRIFETAAIMRFIDEAHPGEANLQPGDALARAHCEQWLSAANSYLYEAAFTGLFFQRALAPQFDIPVNEDLITASVDRTRECLVAVSEALELGELEGHSGPTLADLLVGANLILLEQIDEGEALLSKAPAVRGLDHAPRCPPQLCVDSPVAHPIPSPTTERTRNDRHGSTFK